MSKNVAILVAIAKPQLGHFSELPCSVKDLEAFGALLDATGKYDHIERLVDVSASALTASLRSLSILFENSDELMFYYSGHGTIEGEEFYFVMDGYKSLERDTTGMSRETLHGLLRPFRAAKTIMVLDACHTGTPLTATQQRVFDSRTEFKDLRILAACGQSEEANSGTELSSFTNGFIEALSYIDGPVIYYGDIENGFKNVFRKAGLQNPYFTNQTDGRDIFCEDKEKLKDVIKLYTEGTENQDAELALIEVRDVKIALTDLQVLEKFESNLASADAAQAMIVEFQQRFVESVQAVSSKSHFYDFRFDAHDDYGAIEAVDHIVRNVSNESRIDCFVRAEITQKEKPRIRDPFETFMFRMRQPKEYITEFELMNNSSLEKVHFLYYADPKFMSLSRVVLELVFLPTIEGCIIFSRFSIHLRKSWERFDGSNNLGEWSKTYHDWIETDVENPVRLAKRFVDLMEKHISNRANYLRD